MAKKKSIKNCDTCRHVGQETTSDVTCCNMCEDYNNFEEETTMARKKTTTQDTTIIKEETVMETTVNTEINLEEAAQEMAADTAAHNEVVKDIKKSNIKFGPWMPPTTKMLDAIISFGASFTYDEKIKWPAIGTFDFDAAKHLLDQLHTLYAAGKMTRRYYPDQWKGYYAEKLKIARSIAAKWPECHMDPKLTTENSNSKH